MSSKKPKFYVVWSGRVPGVYTSWDECREQVEGFPGARYKAFASRAEAWLKAHRVTNPILKWETDQWGEIPADFGRK